MIRNNRRQDPIMYGLSLILISTIGLSLSIALTDDQRWLEWHMSRLGEGGHLSSLIFNTTLVLSALLLAAYGSTLSSRIARPYQKVFASLTSIMSGGLIGVAAFPFDKFPTLHNVFGYTFFFTAVGLMLWSSANVTNFSRRSSRIALAAAIVTSSLMILHHLYHMTSLLTAELTGQVTFFCWLISIALDVRKTQKRTYGLQRPIRRLH